MHTRSRMYTHISTITQSRSHTSHVRELHEYIFLARRLFTKIPCLACPISTFRWNINAFKGHVTTIRTPFLPCPSCHDFSLVFSRFWHLDTLDTMEIVKVPARRRLDCSAASSWKNPASSIDSISTLVPNHCQTVQPRNTPVHIRFAHHHACMLRWIAYRSITTAMHPFLSI